MRIRHARLRPQRRPRASRSARTLAVPLQTECICTLYAIFLFVNDMRRSRHEYRIISVALYHVHDEYQSEHINIKLINYYDKISIQFER